DAAVLVARMIGMRLVTQQTAPEGARIEAVLLEELSQVTPELYFAITLDRAKANIVFILSPEGGMDIEEVAEKTPEKVLKLWPSWENGPDDALLGKAAEFLGLTEAQAVQFATIARTLYKVYVETDC